MLVFWGDHSGCNVEDSLGRDKTRDKKTSQEVIAKAQVSNDDGMS